VNVGALDDFPLDDEAAMPCGGASLLWERRGEDGPAVGVAEFDDRVV
jgi:hypothetical protein